jgi:CBS-domain-containing membrane protein
MWEHDCGCVPVVDEHGAPVGMVTDRDVCMAAYTQGRALFEIPVATAMSRKIARCRVDDPVAIAESMMRAQQLRRLPVVGFDGRVVGLVSINDIATHRRSKDEELGDRAIATTLEAICMHRVLGVPPAFWTPDGGRPPPHAPA